MLAGWGASVLPRLLAQPLLAQPLLAQPLLDQGLLVNLAPSCVLPIQLYWHCWNLESEVLDALSCALTRSAETALAG